MWGLVLGQARVGLPAGLEAGPRAELTQTAGKEESCPRLCCSQRPLGRMSSRLQPVSCQHRAGPIPLWAHPPLGTALSPALQLLHPNPFPEAEAGQDTPGGGGSHILGPSEIYPLPGSRGRTQLAILGDPRTHHPTKPQLLFTKVVTDPSPGSLGK